LDQEKYDMKKISLSIFVIIMLGLLLAACQGGAMPGSGSGTPTAVPIAVADTGIVVDGRVVPAETVWLAFDSGGEVAEVLVEEGDVVQVGDVLARLGNREPLEANIASSKLELASAQQELLTAQDALDQLSEDLPERQTAALQALTTAKDELRKAKIKNDNINSPASVADLNEARANYAVAQDRLEKAEDDFEPYEKRSENNLQRAYYLSKLADAQRKFEAAEKNLNKLLGGTSVFFESQAADELKIAQEKLDQAQEEFDTLQAGPDPDELALAENRILTAESRIAAAEAAIKSSEAALDNLDLVATINGTVVNLDLIAGQRVTPGQEVIQLADFSQLYIETDNLTELEVVDITIDEEVSIVPDAIPDLVLTGSVDKIADVFEEKRGDVTYTVRIKLNQVDPRLRWGMTTAVEFGE
jgi:multidrug resistance efflux pump